MKQLIKRFAKWILSEELESDARLTERLRGYCRPHIPKLNGDGITDDTNTLRMMFDVNKDVFLPTGTYKISPAIELGATKGIEEQEQ